MADTTDFRNGLCIEFNNDLLKIIDFQRFQTGRGGSNIRTKLKSLISGKTVEHTFSSGEKIETARIEKRPHQYLYKDETGIVVMDNENFEQINLQEDMIDNFDLMREGDQLEIFFHADKGLPLYGELPQFVELEITYTEPGIKGDTATNTLKPATLETGAEVKVPLFINQGDVIKINAKSREYNERVSK